MLAWLGRAVVRARIAILLAAMAAMVTAGLAAAGVTDRLVAGAFDDSGPEALRAKRILENTFQSGDLNLVLLVAAQSGNVDDGSVAAAGRALTDELSAEVGISDVASYWTTALPSMRSIDGRKALVVARIVGDDAAVEDRVRALSARYTRDNGTVRVSVGGSAEAFRQINERSDEDLVRAESVALPITLVLLIIVFGGIVAGLLPVIVGIFTVLGTLLILYGLGGITDVSVFALNLTTALGLGLAIDYSLIILSRFREELSDNGDPHAAVRRAVATAGRTVLVSGLAVAGSLAALLVFDQMFLRSVAYAGIAVVGCATLAALIVMPALLAVLGHRVNRLTVRRRALRGGGRGWHRVAMTVMRYPVPFALAAVTLLVLLGLPFLGIRVGDLDDRALPRSSSARQVSDQIRAEFETRDTEAIAVVAEGIGDPGARADEIDSYATQLSRLGDVARVDAATGSYRDGAQIAEAGPTSARFAAPDVTRLQVVLSVEPVSPEGEAVVRRIRAMDAPFPVLLTGPSVEVADSKAAIADRLPLAAALIAGVTFLVLLVVFGSVLVPIQALILNVLSLTASFGVLVWGFQEGNLAGLLDFTATGVTESSIPVLLFFLAFGLSMDYEVFLLSRIKEEYDRSGNNTQAVAAGLQRTGPIITAAAALIAVIFIGLVTSSISVVKLLGVGLALAVIVDATVVRAVLVPAFMRLAGRANWWAPPPVPWLHRRVGIRYRPVERGAATPVLAGVDASGAAATPPDFHPAMRASDVVAARLAEFRALRNLTAGQLADRCATLGAANLLVDDVTAIETGRRAASVDELLLLALALDVSVLQLLTPARQRPARVAVTPEVTIDKPDLVRRWLRGETALPQSNALSFRSAALDDTPDADDGQILSMYLQAVLQEGATRLAEQYEAEAQRFVAAVRVKVDDMLAEMRRAIVHNEQADELLGTLSAVRSQLDGSPGHRPTDPTAR